MTDRELHVRIGNANVTVPVVDNPSTTEAIAAQLTEDLARIEKASKRIDTYGSLVQLAYEQAVKNHELRQEREETNRAFLRELSAVQQRLESLVSQFQDTNA